MEKVSFEVAQKEINDWVASKKMSEATQENYKENLDALVRHIQEGFLTIVDGAFVQDLRFPVGDGGAVTSLKYKARFTTGERNKALQGVKASEADERILALIAGLTGQPRNVIKLLDTEDYSLTQTIAIFFAV